VLTPSQIQGLSFAQCPLNIDRPLGRGFEQILFQRMKGREKKGFF